MAMMLLTKDCRAGFSHLAALAVAHTLAGPAGWLGVNHWSSEDDSRELAACSLPCWGVKQCLCLCAREGRAKPQSCVPNHSNHSPCLALILKPGHTLPSLLQRDFSMRCKVKHTLKSFPGLGSTENR